jgi:hypothetical protein
MRFNWYALPTRQLVNRDPRRIAPARPTGGREHVKNSCHRTREHGPMATPVPPTRTTVANRERRLETSAASTMIRFPKPFPRNGRDIERAWNGPKFGPKQLGTGRIGAGRHRTSMSRKLLRFRRFGTTRHGATRAAANFKTGASNGSRASMCVIR